MKLLPALMLALIAGTALLADDPATPGEQYPEIVIVNQAKATPIRQGDPYVQLIVESYSFIPRAGVMSLEWSVDAGETWHEAENLERVDPISPDQITWNLFHWTDPDYSDYYLCRLVLRCPTFDMQSTVGDEYQFTVGRGSGQAAQKEWDEYYTRYTERAQ